MSDNGVNRPYKCQGSRVYGEGKGSYNLNNKHDAIKLQNTLNNYENTIKIQTNTNKKLDKIEKHIITLQMDLSNVQDTVNKIKEVLK